MKTPLFAAVVLAVSLVCCATKQPEKRNVIVAVVAHPDDEAAVAQLLVKFAKTNKVYVIIALDGRYGTKPGFPTGDALVKLRQTESECAAKIFGAQPPIFLGFTDAFDSRELSMDGINSYFRDSTELKRVLAEKLDQLNPDVVLTFGPDGDTGHIDHRMVSNMTTEVILSKGWLERFPLYYLGWQQKDDEKLKKSIGHGLNTVAPQYLNVSISFTEEEEVASILPRVLQEPDDRRRGSAVGNAREGGSVEFISFSPALHRGAENRFLRSLTSATYLAGTSRFSSSIQFCTTTTNCGSSLTAATLMLNRESPGAARLHRFS